MENRQHAAERLRQCADHFAANSRPYISYMALGVTYWDGPIVAPYWAMYWAKKKAWPVITERGKEIEEMKLLGTPGEDEVRQWLGLTHNEYAELIEPTDDDGEMRLDDTEKFALGIRDYGHTLATAGPELFDIRGGRGNDSHGQNTYYSWLCRAVSEEFNPDTDNSATIRKMWRLAIMRALADNWNVSRHRGDDMSKWWMAGHQKVGALAEEIRRLGGDPDEIVAKAKADYDARMAKLRGGA